MTGGIGCGKSVVLGEFKRLGVPCFEADREAAKLYDNPAFCDEVVNLLGRGVLCADGRIDKKAVAGDVFADSAKLAALSSLVHPRVMGEFDGWARRHESEYSYVLCEVAVLYEYGLERCFDKVVCVHLDLEERLRRLLLRDGGPREQLLARIASQLPSEQKMMRADYVILNYEGNPRSRQVAAVDEMLRRKDGRMKGLRV